MPVLVADGPAGPTPTAALLLARRVLPVVIVDARPERDPVGSKALAQQRDVIDIWCAVEPVTRSPPRGVTGTTRRAMCRDRKVFATDWLDRGALQLPAFVNISQSPTEDHLAWAMRSSGEYDQDRFGPGAPFWSP